MVGSKAFSGIPTSRREAVRASSWPTFGSRSPLRETLHIVLDNYKPHLKTEVLQWAAAHRVRFYFTPTNASWLSRIECQFTALRRLEELPPARSVERTAGATCRMKSYNHVDARERNNPLRGLFLSYWPNGHFFQNAKPLN